MPPLNESQKKTLYIIYYTEKNFFGRDKLFEIVKDRKLDISRRQIMDWLKAQETHQLTNQTRRSNVIKPTILKEPNKQIGIDLIDMQNLEYKGFKYILTAIDLFSKKAYAEPLQNKEGLTVAKAIDKIIKHIKVKISSIRSDNGSEFKSAEFIKILQKHDIKQIFSLPSKPQSNGQIERFNGVIKKMIRISLMHTGGFDWVSILQQLIDNYNNITHTTTKKAPNNVIPENYEEVEDNISKKVLKNRDTDEVKFKIGDNVRMKQEKKTKEDYNFSKDLYEIIQISTPKNNITAVSYKIKNQSTGEKYKDKFYNNDLLFIPSVENKINTPKKDIISSIVRPSITKGVQGFIVRWKAPADELYTFEPRDNLLEDVPKMINAFEKKHQVIWLDKRFTWKK